MRTWTTTAATAALTCLAAIALAHHPSHHAKAPKANTKAIICPVTGDRIASVKKAVGHTTFHGKTYYFCCAGCKPRFDKNPTKFVKNAAKHKFEKM